MRDIGTPIPNRRIEDAHAEGSGEVITRPMTLEEWEKYGPPAKRPAWMKRREVVDLATRMERAREALPKEKYIALKEQGLSDVKIMKEVGLGAWFDVMSRLKEEWGLAGMRLDRPSENATENEKTAPVGYPESAERTFTPAADTAENAEPEDDDEILWVKPFKPVKETPILRFYERGITLNAHACRMMDGVRHIRVGTTKKGVIVLVASEGGDGCYDVGSWTKTSGSIKVGGGLLVKELQDRGIMFGYYTILYNEAKKRWEAATR